MSSKAKKKKLKGKKVSFKDKQWFKVITPKTFDFKPIGEISGFENNLVGRTLETLLFGKLLVMVFGNLKINSV